MFYGLKCIIWYLIILHCFALHCIVWYLMLSYGIAWYFVVLNGIPCYCVVGFSTGCISQDTYILLYLIRWESSIRLLFKLISCLFTAFPLKISPEQFSFSAKTFPEIVKLCCRLTLKIGRGNICLPAQFKMQIDARPKIVHTGSDANRCKQMQKDANRCTAKDSTYRVRCKQMKIDANRCTAKDSTVSAYRVRSNQMQIDANRCRQMQLDANRCTAKDRG